MSSTRCFGGQRTFGHLVGVVFALAAVMLIRGYAVPILCVLFVLFPPVKYLLASGAAATGGWRMSRCFECGNSECGMRSCMRRLRIASCEAMFTGLVEAIGEVLAVAAGRRRAAGC